MGKTVGNLDKHIQIDLSNFSVNGHTHSYVPLSGGTMTGNLKFTDVTSTTYPAVSSKITWNGSTDGADIYYQVDAADKGRLVLNTRDDSDCVIAFANKGTIKTTIDANGNFSGKAAKADTLNTARTLTIGNTGKTFNGSANVSWSLSEIGAAAASHTHNILKGKGRVTDANIAVSGDNTISYLLSTSAMTANKPVADGKIIHFEWDNTGGWSSQLFLEHTTTPRMQIRGMNSGTWGDWINVYTSANKPTPADIGAATSSHGTHVTYSTTTPKANGTASVGSESKVARGDHVHPLQASAATWTTARTLTIGNKGQSVNGSANVSWSLADIGAVETVAWNASIKCATWSRLFQYSAASAVIGGAFLVNIQATRGNVVYGPTVLVNFGHSSTCNIVQINNISYSNIKIRGVVDSNGAGYLEIYDNANGATNSTTQSVTVSVTKLTKGLSITKYTSFTDGSTIPTNYTSKGEITTVSGCYYTGKAATSGNADTATKLKTARTLTIGNTGKTFDGSANVSWTLAEIGALPTAGGTMTGILTIGPVAYDSGYTKAGTFTDTNVKRSMIKFAAVSGSSDPGAIYLETSATTADTNKGVLHLCPSDDNNNDGTDYVSIHGTNDAENIKLHTGGAASFAGTVTAPTFSGALSGNAATATKAAQLTTARKINGTSFNGTADITTANWGTSRKINQISVNGSADVKLPLDYYTCSISSDNTNLYHHILASGQCTGNYTDKSITIVLVNHYNGAGLGIAKATLRTNKASDGGTATAELRWLVRSGFSENQLCYNIRNTAQDTYMDVFYKSVGTYNSLTWYVLTEGARGNHSSQWTKYNTNASGTNAYTEANMKTLRTYTSTLVSAGDHGNVNYAKSANTATSATTASAANVLNKNTRMDYGWDGLNYFNISGTAGNAAKANDTPTTAWWHIIRCNHANSTGYYTDIAVPFNATSMYYKRITGGSVQNGGWVQILDKLNYKSIATPANIGAEVATATHSTVDITSSGFSSSGTKTADTMASTGNCYQFVSTSTATKLAAGNFNNVKFGKYALCLRVRTSNNTTTSNILTVTVKHGSTTILTKNIKGTDFSSTSNYCNIYTSFDFNGTSSARGTLSFQLNTTTVTGITLKFDYAYITLMAPSVFI